MRIARTLLISGAAVVTGVALFAQGRNIGNEWPTALGDAQRTNWMRSDPNISAETLAKPGFELQWRAGLEGQRGLKPAVQGVTVNGVTLFTPLSIVTGMNDAIAIDNDTGETFWYKTFGPAPAASGACTATPVAATRQAPLVPAAPTVGGAGGRGGRGGYSSAVGNPGEGAPIPAGAGRGGANAAGAGRGAGAPNTAPPAGAPAAGAPPAGTPPPGAPAAAPQGARRGRRELRLRQAAVAEAAVGVSAVRPASCMRSRATACCTWWACRPRRTPTSPRRSSRLARGRRICWPSTTCFTPRPPASAVAVRMPSTRWISPVRRSRSCRTRQPAARSAPSP